MKFIFAISIIFFITCSTSSFEYGSGNEVTIRNNEIKIPSIDETPGGENEKDESDNHISTFAEEEELDYYNDDMSEYTYHDSDDQKIIYSKPNIQVEPEFASLDDAIASVLPSELNVRPDDSSLNRESLENDGQEDYNDVKEHLNSKLNPEIEDEEEDEEANEAKDSNEEINDEFREFFQKGVNEENIRISPSEIQNFLVHMKDYLDKHQQLVFILYVSCILIIVVLVAFTSFLLYYYCFLQPKRINLTKVLNPDYARLNQGTMEREADFDNYASKANLIV